MLTIYGIKTCDTCRKALKQLADAGHSVVLHDVRQDPLTQGKLSEFLDEFGEELINKRSTTWRGLDDGQRDQAPVDLLMAHPTLLKRPVIEGENGRTLGWAKNTQAHYLET